MKDRQRPTLKQLNPKINMAKKKEEGFDSKMQRIRKIAEILQNRQLSLEDSLELYQEAKGLIQSCHDFLEQAELKVREVTE
jgi:exodeoxyribonuclease VII small subunit